MIKRTLFASCLLLALAQHTSAAPSSPAQLTLMPRAAPGAGEVRCEELRAQVRPVAAAEAEPGEATEQPAELGKPLTLVLEAGAWEVTVAGRGCWAPWKKVVVPAPGARPLEVPVFRATEAVGTVRSPAGSALPAKLRLMFSTSLANDVAKEPRADVFCPLGKDGRFRCPLPVARLDLRLSVEGFAPLYWWGTAPTPGAPFDLGSSLLTPGAALAGWLTTEERKPPVKEGITLSLVPRGLTDTRSPEEERQQQVRRHEAKPLANGFFQFHSLSAGSYMLLARGPGYAELRLPVEVVAGRESQLYDPLLLAPPLTATFSITPPSDVEGGAWRILVQRLHESGTYADPVADEAVPLDGWYEAKGLNPGVHLVQLFNTKGDGVAAREVRVGEEPMPILVEVGGVLVEGTITLGRKPIAATIWFGGQMGAEKVTAESGKDGTFRATLPRAGEWVIEAAAEKPPLKNRWRRFEIAEPKAGKAVAVDLAMPATRLWGTVREADGGAPRQPTRVYAITGRPGRHPSQRISPTGGFEFNGLAEGAVRLVARRSGGSSRAVEVLLAADLEQEVNLLLEPTRLVRGMVVGPHGGIPGATVQLQPTGDPWAWVPSASCDGAGRFEVDLPGGPGAVDATVAAPGGTLGAFRSVLAEGEELRLLLPADGGTLAIELPEEGIEWDGETMPIFFRDGVPFGSREVEMWAGNHQRTAGRPGFLVAPNMVAGHYEACHVPIADYGPTILGQLARRHCVAGSLSPLGELTLKLPSLKKKGA